MAAVFAKNWNVGTISTQSLLLFEWLTVRFGFPILSIPIGEMSPGFPADGKLHGSALTFERFNWTRTSAGPSAFPLFCFLPFFSFFVFHAFLLSEVRPSPPPSVAHVIYSPAVPLKGAGVNTN